MELELNVQVEIVDKENEPIQLKQQCIQDSKWDDLLLYQIGSGIFAAVAGGIGIGCGAKWKDKSAITLVTVFIPWQSSSQYISKLLQYAASSGSPTRAIDCLSHAKNTDRAAAAQTPFLGRSKQYLHCSQLTTVHP